MALVSSSTDNSSGYQNINLIDKIVDPTTELTSNIICNTCRKDNTNAHLLCDRCKQFSYCDLKCKDQDWPLHKLNCIMFGKETIVEENKNIIDESSGLETIKSIITEITPSESPITKFGEQKNESFNPWLGLNWNWNPRNYTFVKKIISDIKDEVRSIAVNVVRIRENKTQEPDEAIIDLFKRIGITANNFYKLSSNMYVKRKDLEFVKSGLKVSIHVLAKELTHISKEERCLKNRAKLHREILLYKDQDLIDLLHIYLDICEILMPIIIQGGQFKEAAVFELDELEIKTESDPIHVDLAKLETCQKDELYILQAMSNLTDLSEESVKKLTPPNWIQINKDLLLFEKTRNEFAREWEGWSKVFKGYTKFSETVEDLIKNEKRIIENLNNSTISNLNKLNAYLPKITDLSVSEFVAQQFEILEINPNNVSIDPNAVRTFEKNVDNNILTITNS